MKKIATSGILLFSLLLSYAPLAQAQLVRNGLPDSAQIVKFLHDKKIPALGLAFIDHNRVITAKVYGVLKAGRPAPETAIFNVASITKTITTMVTLRLVNSGKWDLNEPLCHYWTDPDVAGDPRSKLLTTFHVLTHQTGFPNWRGMLPDKKLAFQFDPGTRFQYSGEGMEYLRRALEHKFHRNLEQLADSLIFKPLHMNDTRMTWDESMISRFAVQHNDKGDTVATERNTQPSAADLLKTTVPDYAKFMLWVNKGAGLSKALFRQMTSPIARIKDGKYMGLGFAVYPHLPGGEYGLSHSGHDEGVNTIAFFLPQSGKGLLIFTNSDNGWQLYSDLTVGFLGKQGTAIKDIEMKN